MTQVVGLNQRSGTLLPPGTVPSILGSFVAHPGLGPTAWLDALLNGSTDWTIAGDPRGITFDLHDAMIDAVISFKIDGTATVTYKVEDDHRVALRNAISQTRTTTQIDDVVFALAEVIKNGPELDMVFEHAVPSRLKDHTETVVAAAPMSRTDFCLQLISVENWIHVWMPAGGSAGIDSSGDLTAGDTTGTTAGTATDQTIAAAEQTTAQVTATTGPLTYAQVEAFWIQAGGDPSVAPTMAAIAMVESRLDPNAVQQGQPYATTGWGLWQITPGNSESQVGVDNQLLDPLTNAQAAVAKYKDAGGLSPWAGDDGIYQQYLPDAQAAAGTG